MKPPFPADSFPLGFDDGSSRWKPDPMPGDRARRLAITLFLISLTSLFVASLIGYILVRFTGPLGAATHPMELPRGLWWSSGVLLVCGVFVTLMHRAARDAALGRLRVLIPLTWAMSVAFLTLQTPCVLQLARSHQASLAAGGYVPAHGLVFTLIVLHALHIVGGLVPLTLLLLRTLRRTLTPASLGSIRSCAVYWHFLEAVWMTMFATFFLVG